MSNIVIDSSPIIECNVDKIQVQDHEHVKDNLLHIIHDLYQHNVNYNTTNHASVWTSPNGLQSIHSFGRISSGPEVVTYANMLMNRYKIKNNKRIAITDMWVTIIPPGGMTVPHRKIKSLVTGVYFLNIPAENASINFKKPIDPHWYDKIYDPFNRTHYNCHEELLRMQEGFMYFYPSYIESYTTTNVSDSERIMIEFVMDSVDK